MNFFIKITFYNPRLNAIVLSILTFATRSCSPMTVHIVRQGNISQTDTLFSETSLTYQVLHAPKPLTNPNTSRKEEAKILKQLLGAYDKARLLLRNLEMGRRNQKKPVM